jgi:putative FmdB family regulatory protein
VPLYEYVCLDCRKRSTHLFLSFTQVQEPVCPRCGSGRMRRLISRVALRRGSASPDSPEFLESFDESDPRAIGRLARAMSDELGEDLPGEYEEMVRELESGKLPEDLEAPTDEGTGDDATA